YFFFFSSRRRHTRFSRDWSSDVCSSDLRLRPVGTGFVGSAPVRLVFERNLSAAPDPVFRALAEDVPGWTAWFGAVTLARPTDGRSEERRVGKGCRARGWRGHERREDW